MFSSDFISTLQRSALDHREALGRPLITLSYAQSLDGSLTHKRGQPLALSGPESLEFTHRLRNASDAILVGIGTVLADDPRLTVRSIVGNDPQPVVLDSRLRFPLNARLWSHPCHPWIFTGPGTDPERRRAVEALGGRLFEIPFASGRYLDLFALIESLSGLGVASLMVEGGAAVITSFLAAGLVDRVAITIAPVFIGGLRLLEEQLAERPALRIVESLQLGKDIVVLGAFDRRN
jgi:3,4-dihydroxy 2-butanone 4-phosphate synthase/GTP cyclohydrolase II